MVTRAQVVDKAASYVGTLGNGANNQFTQEWNINGQNWCAAFVSSIFWRLGAPLPSVRVTDGFLYVPYAVDYARANGQAVEVPAQALPGDVVLYCWDGVRAGPPGTVGDHTGIVSAHDGGSMIQTIEGNTVPDAGGTNGVWHRNRATAFVACYWRPLVFDGDGPELTAEEHEWLRRLMTATDAASAGWRFPSAG